MFSDEWTDNPRELRLRAVMRQYYEDCLDLGVLPIVVIAVQDDPDHTVYYLHDTSMTLAMLRACFEDSALTMARRMGIEPEIS